LLDASGFPASGPASAPASAPRPRILLAEDDREMRRALGWGLRRAGYDVREFADACDLSDHIADQLVCHRGGALAELIISDIRMPGGSGLGLLEGLREFDGATPVILITAFGSASTHAVAAALGARVLDKPFDIEELLALVRKALAGD
jgi:DNA-binding response OmpR family regulator